MSQPHTDRRTFFKAAGAAALAAAAPAAPVPQREGEWRNKQSPMAYRRLGRTGLMVSEVLSGGDPIRSQNYDHLSLAIEKGLNYFDMAPSYGRGDCEIAYGKFLSGSSAKREKVFLTTKISGYTALRDSLYEEIFNGLSGLKQTAILARADELMAERGVAKPGYFLEYFPNQMRRFKAAYVSNAMMPEYGHRVEGSPRFKEYVLMSIEESLKRIGTDYFDIVMAPHGASCMEELDNPHIYEAFSQLKKEGKVRFLGVTSHNDPGGVLRKAAEVGYYDCAQVAYNVVNGGYVEDAIRLAQSKNMGVIAMKAAMAVATHHKPLQPVPQWRIDKIHRIVPGEMKAPMKAYLWALQNPGISAVVSNLWDKTFIEENLSLAGKKVELQAA